MTRFEAQPVSSCKHYQRACLGDRLGTLQPGKVADCIVIDGDPLTDISVLTARESIAM